MFTYMLIYDCFVIFNYFRMFLFFGYAHLSFQSFRLCPLLFSSCCFFCTCFSATPIFGYAHSAKPAFLCNVFGHAHFSFEVDFRLCSFSAMPAIVFYICVFRFPPLYANRSNAIGGEGRFFYVSTAFVPSFRQL